MKGAGNHEAEATIAISANKDVAAGETVALRSRPSAAIDLPTVPEGNYDRENEIARGGMGRIVAAWDRRLGRPVAIKELLHSTDELKRRFEREAVMTARLQHPAIINVYEAGRWPNGEPFYAMKRVDGRSLADAIQATTSFTERLSLLPNLIAIVEAMAYAHGQHVIHRDLKPANVLLGSFGESVVIDWGLAKDLSAGLGGSERLTAAVGAEDGLTISGTVMGTPAYMPPEQARGWEADERADVYALGAILYHLLAGQAPYSGQSSAEVLRQVLDSAPRPLDAREPGVAADLLAIVRKAMARDASERYPTAKDLSEDLKRFQTGQLVGAHPYSTMELAQRWLARHRAPASIAMIAAAVLAAAGVVAVQRIARERNEAQSARKEAEGRNAELVLNQARGSLRDDPTSAIAWLKNYPLDGPSWGAARTIAADARSQGVATRVLAGHEARVNAVAFSADGRYLASGSSDKMVRVWDVASGASRVLTGHDWFVYSLAFSPDGRFLASIGGSTLWLWDVATGEGRSQRAQFVDRDIAFSPDGRALAALAIDNDGPFVLLCDTQTGFTRMIRDPTDKGKWRRGQKSVLLTLAFSPDGMTLFSRTDDDVLRQWDMKGSNRRVAGVRAFAVSGDGRWIATASAANQVRISDRDTGRVRSLPGRSGPVSFLALSPDGQWIASASADALIRVWNLNTGQLTALSGHSGAVHRVAFSSDSRTLTSFADDRTVRLWDVASGEGQEFRGHLDKILGVALAPDGKTVASASADRTIRLWPTGAGENRILFRSEKPSENLTRRITFGQRGRVLAATRDGGSIHVWDLRTGVRRELRGHDEKKEGAQEIGQMVISPDGETVAYATADGNVSLRSVATGDGPRFHGHDGRVLDLGFSPDGKWLASGGMDATVRLWKVESGASRTLRGHENPVGQVAFSPDGRWLASASIASRNEDGQKDLGVQLWEVNTGVGAVLPGHTDTVTAVVFSPDGQTMASGSMDTSIRLWDVATRRVSKVLNGGGSQILQLIWSPDGRWLASGNQGGTTRLWNPTTGRSDLFSGFDPDFSEDGGTLVTSRDGVAHLWDTASGEGRTLSDAYSNVAISPDGKLIAVIGRNGAVHLWRDDLPRERAALRNWLLGATDHRVGVGDTRPRTTSERR